MATDFTGFNPPSFSRMRPVGNTTPFTYQDGSTFLEILHRMQDYITDEMVPGVNGELSKFNAEINRFIEEIENGLEVDRTKIAEIYNEFVSIIREQVELINNKTGPMDIQRATVTGPYTVNINPLWPNNQPVYFMLKQAGTGGHAISLASNIAGPLDVNTVPNGVTEFWVFPNADKTSWQVFQPASGVKGTPNDRAASKLISTVGTATRQAVDALLAPVLERVTEFAKESAARDVDNLRELNTEMTKVDKVYPLGAIDVVFIGDSWFTGYQKSGVPYVKDMPTRVVELLNAQGLNEYRKRNYGWAGSGFSRSGPTNDYNGQMDRAIADVDITNCRLVIIGGGQNDADADIYESAMSVFTKARKKWPAAKIIYVPMWSAGKLTAQHRKTFMRGIAAAKDCGVIFDVNSLWTNSFTVNSDWEIENNVWHPKDKVTQNFANAIYSIIQGGSLPAQIADFWTHSSTGTSVGMVTLDGFTVTLSLQQYVGAAFGPSYDLASLNWKVASPGSVNQYITGYAGNGGTTQLYTIEAGTGNIFVAGTGQAAAGVVGFTGSYPIGM